MPLGKCDRIDVAVDLLPAKIPILDLDQRLDAAVGQRRRPADFARAVVRVRLQSARTSHVHRQRRTYRSPCSACHRARCRCSAGRAAASPACAPADRLPKKSPIVGCTSSGLPVGCMCSSTTRSVPGDKASMRGLSEEAARPGRASRRESDRPDSRPIARSDRRSPARDPHRRRRAMRGVRSTRMLA